MKYDVFISYSRDDYYDASGNVMAGNTISLILKFLKDNGVKYWFDRRFVQAGESFSKEINEAIENCNFFLFISSVNSNASEWAEGEVAIARSKEKRIIPFKMDASPYSPSINLYLQHLHYIDYIQDRKQALNEVLNAITGKDGYLDELVKLDYSGPDIATDDFVLSQKVLSIFNSNKLTDALADYISVVEHMKGEESNKRLDEIVKQFSYINTLVSFYNQKEEIRNCSRNISRYLHETKRLERLLLLLAQMLCLYRLGEMTAVSMVQTDVASSKYEMTFWERNGGTIQQIGLPILTAVLFKGMVGRVGTGFLAGTHGANALESEHSRKLDQLTDKYNTLRNIIAALKFGI